MPNPLCLGRLPHDPARVAAVRPHVAGVSAPLPASVQDARSTISWSPSLVKNDQWSTCTVAGLINSARWWALLHGFDLTNDETMELAFFAAVAGVPDTDAAMAAVPGLVMLDVIERAQHFGFDVGAPAPLVPDFATIRQSLDALKDAISTQGSAYVGLQLYEADMVPGATWQGGTSKAGKVVGGHCLLPIDLASGTFDLATWGSTEQADEEWLLSRIDEAYVLQWTFPVATP